MEKFIMLFLILINSVSFSLMGIDKSRARKGQYRISEQTLWLAALFGGAAGSFAGMKYFRHKTKHTAFKYGLPLLTAIEFAVILYLTAEGI